MGWRGLCLYSCVSTSISLYLYFPLSILFSICISLYLYSSVSIFLGISISLYLYFSVFVFLSLFLSLYISVYLYFSVPIFLRVYISLYLYFYLYFSVYIFYIYFCVCICTCLCAHTQSPRHPQTAPQSAGGAAGFYSPGTGLEIGVGGEGSNRGGKKGEGRGGAAIRCPRSAGGNGRLWAPPAESIEATKRLRPFLLFCR